MFFGALHSSQTETELQPAGKQRNATEKWKIVDCKLYTPFIARINSTPRVTQLFIGNDCATRFSKNLRPHFFQNIGSSLHSARGHARAQVVTVHVQRYPRRGFALLETVRFCGAMRETGW